jgi:hypothetical protein
LDDKVDEVYPDHGEQENDDKKDEWTVGTDLVIDLDPSFRKKEGDDFFAIKGSQGDQIEEK